MSGPLEELNGIELESWCMPAENLKVLFRRQNFKDQPCNGRAGDKGH